MSGEEERLGSGEGSGRVCEVPHIPCSISVSSVSSAPWRENWLRVSSALPAPAFVFLVCFFFLPSAVVLARLSLDFGGFADVADVEAARLGANNPASISSSVSSSNPALPSNFVPFFRFLVFCFTRSSATLTKLVQAP